ncbi:MAG TPA: hypothetical protein VI895_14700 [Bdellovibrionota bacterium]|nr:hypothetical protein [Bdellovibrionota bacterium]
MEFEKILKYRSLSQEHLEELLAIGAALSSELNLDRLPNRILELCRRLTTADAGSLYLAERPFTGQSHIAPL